MYRERTIEEYKKEVFDKLDDKTKLEWLYQASKQIIKGIEYIDQIIMYKPGARELDEELNELIGILGGKDE